MTFIRTLLFNIFYFAWTLILSVIGTLLVFFPRSFSLINAKFWSRSTMFALDKIVGLKYHVEGLENLPADGRYVLASKHQSAFETIAFHAIFNRPAFILKKELLWLPIFGWNLLITGCIPIDRSSGTKAMRSILDGAKKRLKQNRCVVIFPEGTRTAPRTTAKYNPGVGLLYEQCDAPLIPVSLNSGEFWRRKAFIKRKGMITIKILPAIQKGMNKRAFIEELQKRIEENYPV